MIRKTIIILGLTLFTISAGCSRNVTLPACPPRSPYTIRLDVPPLYQAAFQCGPAALTMVMHYYGVDILLETVTAKVYTVSLEGTLITDMKMFALKYFPRSRIEKITLCEIIDYLSRGIPPILYVDLGGEIMKRPHYLVATGYDLQKNILFVHNGYDSNAPATFEAIEKAWEKTGHLALIVER